MGKEVEFLLLFSTERKKHSGMDEAFGVFFFGTHFTSLFFLTTEVFQRPGLL